MRDARRKARKPKRKAGAQASGAPRGDASAPRSETAGASDPPRSKPDGAGSRLRRWAVVVSVLAVVGAVGFAAFRYLAVHDPEPLVPISVRTAAIDAAPQGAAILVLADMRALRASPLVAPYLAGDREVEGLGKLREACGFDPIASIDEIALVVPDAPDSDFGVVAVGGFADTAVLECAGKIVSARGGKPVASTVGSFKTVRDSTTASSGEVASRPGGILLLGGGTYLRTMIDTADGALPSAKSDAVHAELDAALSEYATVRVTFALSPTQRATINEEIGASGGRAPKALASVKAAAVGLRLVGDKAEMLAILRCDDPSAAIDVAAFLNQSRERAASAPVTTLINAAPLVQRIAVSVEGSDVRAKLDVTVAEVEAVVDRAMQLRQMLSQPEPSPSDAPSAESAAPRASAAPR